MPQLPSRLSMLGRWQGCWLNCRRFAAARTAWCRMGCCGLKQLAWLAWWGLAVQQWGSWCAGAALCCAALVLCCAGMPGLLRWHRRLTATVAAAAPLPSAQEQARGKWAGG